MSELRRLIVRHRHVAPMISTLLAGTDAAVTIRDAEGELILDRRGGVADAPGGHERHEITVERDVLGTVDGGRTARAVASVLSYAAARERDKRSLATEALERYRELSLIYDLAATIGAAEDESAVVEAAERELGRLPGNAVAFVVLGDGRGELVGARGPFARVARGEGVLGGAAERGEAELVDDLAEEPLASAAERAHRAIVVAPLRVDERTIGVLGAASATPAAFRSSDLKVVSAVAALAGPAIGQLRRHAASLAHRLGVDHPVHR
jgi:GAF domain-containing protein